MNMNDDACKSDINFEIFIQNKDIQKMQNCCPGTATKIIKKIKKKYDIREDELPRANVIPLSCYEDMFRKKKPKRRELTNEE